MRRFLDSLYAASLVLAACFLVGILLLMVGEAVVRSLGGYITGANELIGWSCAAAGFLALPSTFKKGLIRVGFRVDGLAPPLRKVLLLLSLSWAWIFVGYMLKAVGLYLYDGWVHEEISQGMIMVPVWIPQSSFLRGSLHRPGSAQCVSCSMDLPSRRLRTASYLGTYICVSAGRDGAISSKVLALSRSRVRWMRPSPAL